MARPARPTVAPTPRPAPRPPWAAALALGMLVAAAIVVWRGAIGYGFSQDDFASLARQVGLLPRLDGPWRILGNQLVFDLLHPIAGLDAAPYHATSLLVHLACAALAWRRFARRVSAPAAWVGAAWFVTHPALFTAVYWFSAIADGIALLFALLALEALDARGRRRWLAAPLFALSLLSKESTVLLPVAAAVMALRDANGARRAPWRDPVLASLAAIAVAFLGYFAGTAYGRHFVTAGTPGAAAYAVGLGDHVWQNALTLIGWSVNLWLPTVRGVSDAVDPAVWPWAIAAVAAWLAGLAAPALRRRGWVEGGVWFAAMLLPVLPLRHHTYHYYLDAPLVGAAACLAALVDAALARFDRGARRAAAPVAWGVATALALVFTLNARALVTKIETHPFLRPELRADPIVDRARIARHVVDDLRAASLPPGTRLAFWSPQARAESGPPPKGPDGTESYWERNVRNALLDGLAVRVMVPQVVETRFVGAFEPLPEPWRYAVYRIDGGLRVGTSAELERVLSTTEPTPR